MKRIIHLNENTIRKIVAEVVNDIGNEMLDRKACMEVYRSNRNLQQCGTFEQYLDYVSSIFPNSRMKNIVYHGSTFEFSEFEHGHYCTSGDKNKNYYKAGFWFMRDKGAANFYTDKLMCFLKNLIRLKKVYKPTLYSVKLNIQNPKIIDREGGRGVDNTPVNDAFDSGNDSLVVRNVIDPTVVSDVYVVFDSKNIHILGNDNDVNGFINFCKSGRQIG